jgi:hypothetical protein
MSTQKTSDWSNFVPSLIVTVIGTGLLGLGLAWASAEIQRRIDEGVAATATCDNPQQLRLLEGATATSSSELHYTDANGTEHPYPAAQLVDGDRQKAWIAAAADGGVGTEVTVQLPANEDVRLLCVLNGYVKDGETYAANGSVRVLEVSTANGSRDAALPRLNETNLFDYQPVVFVPGRTESITLRVQVSDVPPQSTEFGPTSAALTELEIWVK